MRSDNSYKVTIDSATKELNAKERIALKDLGIALKLDTLTQTEDVIIDVDYSAVLSVHNEKSENVDYLVYIIVSKDGTHYMTGSESFWNAYNDIAEEMNGEDLEWKIKVFRLPSKNRPGKDFLTCTII